VKRRWILLIGLCFLASCQTTATSLYVDDRDDMTGNMVKIAAHACANGFDEDWDELLAVNMTPLTACSCAFEAFFESMTDKEFDQFMTDAERSGDDLGDKEPWKSRAVRFMLACLADGIGEAA